MNKTWKWVIGVGAALLVLLLLAMPFFGRLFWMSGGHMTGQTGVPMGAGFSDGCGGIFGGPMSGLWNMGGGLMMFGMFLVPLLLIGLVVVVVVALMRRPQMIVQPQPVAISCASCGKAVQENWVVCPYCGDKRT